MPREVPPPPDWHDPPAHTTITLRLKLITPMFGGGYEPREVDPLMPIRPAAIRGHLRFWWRALYGGQYTDSEALFKAEKAIWGSMEEPGKVRIRSARLDQSNPTVCADDVPMQAPDSYALWPARATRGDNPQPPAQRIEQGLEFRVCVFFPSERTTEVENTLRAWVLFGGVGGRTRRGCGALAVTSVERNGEKEESAHWVPATAALIPKMLESVLSLPKPAGQTPLLTGATLYVGNPQPALNAWYEALRWLKEFRQGSGPDPKDRAREPDPTGKNRPSISNWPEADKVRRIMGKPHHLEWAHAPRHNATPVWPRAGFGLPIVGQFQQQSRVPDPKDPKGMRKLRWNQLTPQCTSPISSRSSGAIRTGTSGIAWRVP